MRIFATSHGGEVGSNGGQPSWQTIERYRGNRSGVWTARVPGGCKRKTNHPRSNDQTHLDRCSYTGGVDMEEASKVTRRMGRLGAAWVRHRSPWLSQTWRRLADTWNHVPALVVVVHRLLHIDRRRARPLAARSRRTSQPRHSSRAPRTRCDARGHATWCCEPSPSPVSRVP